jgi:alkanesulfonate monooxygenase SsuD/methylene tetrahydromethanopterin reductase-like flavin-dependent oxidoreductase (luciferase family)
LKMCSGFASVEALIPAFEAYQEGARSAGMPTGPDQVAIRRVVHVIEDGRDVDDALVTAKEANKEFFAVSMEAAKIPDAPDRPLEKDEVIVGTADQVADEIIRQCTSLGAGNFLATFNVFDVDELRKHHELFGRHVIPQLRAAGLG